MEQRGKRRLSFAWTAAAWVALIALLAAGGLFVLRKLSQLVDYLIFWR